MEKISRIILVSSRLMFGGVILGLILVALAVGIVGGTSIRQEKNVLTAVGRNVDGVVLAASGENEGEAKPTLVSDKVVAEDARPLLIKRYLEKYKSPLVPYADLIFKLSETYGFPYYWIVAIGQQESNLCKKIPEGSHNCWGYGIHKKGTLKFESYELALNSYAEYLKRAYFDKGLNTPELIMKKYCPHSNGSWAYGVQQFIDEIESGDF